MKTVFAIFGGTGELSRHRLYPALFELYRKGQIDGKIIGCARSEIADEEFRKTALSALASRASDPAMNGFSSMLSYARADYSSPEPFAELKKAIGKADALICHLAVPEDAFAPIVKGLARTFRTKAWRKKIRILVEKPFGHDSKSACRLNRTMHRAFGEENIYRIDHFLAKEVVENLLVVRFANELFRAVWNNRHIESVQVSFSEPQGMDGRGQFYEKTGALRDFVQSHVMQVIGLLAMETPKCLDDDCIKDGKALVLRNLAPLKPSDVVFGQYQEGEIAGHEVPAYNQEKDVSPQSGVETFVAMKVFVNRPEWEGVPFYIRTGKRMAKKEGVISVVFKNSQHLSFGKSVEASHHNVLQLSVDPEEIFRLKFNLKTPQQEISIKPFHMEYCYSCEHLDSRRKPYEKIFEDAMHGDKTRFSRSDEVEHAWKWVETLKKKPQLHFYKAGSDGPKEADELLAKNGHKWLA